MAGTEAPGYRQPPPTPLPTEIFSSNSVVPRVVGQQESRKIIVDEGDDFVDPVGKDRLGGLRPSAGAIYARRTRFL